MLSVKEGFGGKAHFKEGTKLCNYCNANGFDPSDIFKKLGQGYCCSCGELLPVEPGKDGSHEENSVAPKPVSPCSVPISDFLTEFARKQGLVFGGRTGRFKDIAEFWKVCLIQLC
jgi:hypothetical protein